MKELWVLTERSDFERGGKYDYQNYRSSVRAFDSFEAAKKAMRRRISEIALEDNSMFVNGKIPIEPWNDCTAELDLANIINAEDNSMFVRGKFPIKPWDECTAELDLADIINNVLADPEFTLDPKSKRLFTEKYGVSSIDADFDKEGYTNYMYGFGLTDEEEPQLICHGHDDGPCNGINPYVYINCFNMSDPDKKYSFHIIDLFEEKDFTSHLFIDLEKAILE